MKHQSVILLALVMPMSLFAIAQSQDQSPLGGLLKKAESAFNKQKSSGLTSDKIAAGLKEALKISTGKAVAQTGRPDGFLKNEAIKILLPSKLQTVSKGL